jgi:GH43 family beta-xylosidase
MNRFFETPPARFPRCFPPGLVATWLLAATLCGLGSEPSATGQTFTNPVVADGADPWIAFRNGYYYLTFTTGSNVQIRRAPRLAGTNGIGRAAVSMVFQPPSPFNKNVWAPELHFLRGKAYLYYAADDGVNANHRMFVAESSSPGPGFSFTAKGKVHDPANDRWAIDGTVLETGNGSLFFIWSGWPSTQDGLQNLYIAPMSDPLTISGPRVLLSTPDLPWESWIQEGPTVLQRDGRVFVIYAANLSWTDNECLGLLLNTTGDYLNRSSWKKFSNPVFKTFSGPNGSVFGPGHCSFTRSLDGTEDWIFYHAAKSSGSGWSRSIRMQRFGWAPGGNPNFGQPIATGVELAIPAGDQFTPARVTLLGPASDLSWRLGLTAPLPLSSTSWAVEVSEDLVGWTSLTNFPGVQYTAELFDRSTNSQRFYRARAR